MIRSYFTLVLLLLLFSFKSTAQNSQILVKTKEPSHQISKHIYGHFAEHLGRCIYGGIYVGDKSAIPNKDGVRTDIINALKDLKIPNLRWPGGCFADTYHWKDGIGPKDQRKPIENLSWGNIREDNSFGTHEFLNLCEELKAEPYLAANMNSGSVQEAMEWVQYTNSKNNSSFLTDLREKNGRSTPWKVKYWGLGNESWDCGGAMTAEYYSNLYKQYATAVTSYSNTEKLFRIAVGPGSEDYNWTETIMKNVPSRRMEGLSIHHYSVFDWSNKGSSTLFTDKEYFKTMQQAWKMDRFVKKNIEVMDKYDPENKVALVVDEWGGWYETDKDGNGALYQQNTMRDAMIAGMTLNIFNNNAKRIKMANLAQTVNVLQAVILTKDEKMLLSPTYHVMKMYNVHQDATLIPTQIASSEFIYDYESLPAITSSASKDASGKIHITLTNIDLNKEHKVNLTLDDVTFKNIQGSILTSKDIRDHNTFENPYKIKPEKFTTFKLANKNLEVSIPKHSVVLLELN